VSLFSHTFGWISILDPVLHVSCAECKNTWLTLINSDLDLFFVHHLYVCFIAFRSKEMLQVSCWSFLLVTQQHWGHPSWHVPRPRTIITLKCLDTSVLTWMRVTWLLQLDAQFQHGWAYAQSSIFAAQQHGSNYKYTPSPSLRGTNNLFDAQKFNNICSQKYGYNRVYCHHVGGWDYTHRRLLLPHCCLTLCQSLLLRPALNICLRWKMNTWTIRVNSEWYTVCYSLFTSICIHLFNIDWILIHVHMLA
jgi:hypothetical protein